MSFICLRRKTLDKVLIVGCGDIGRRVAALCQERETAVWGVARGAAQKLAGSGIQVLQQDLDAGFAWPAGLVADTVLYLAPPPPEGDIDPRLAGFLAALPPSALPAKLVYISTSGVYGDCGGAWVDETAALRPASARARRRLAAEQSLAVWRERRDVAVVILRVAGIYGPGRWPLEALRRGRPVIRRAECPPTNLIHADDLARICVAAMEAGQDGAVYNVADGHPLTLTEYHQAVARHFGLPPPPEISFAEARRRFSPALLSFLTESRRLDNRRLLRELAINLRYPDLNAALEGSRD